MKIIRIACMAGMGAVMPLLSMAQSDGSTNGVQGLQQVLDQLYAEMLPQCGRLISVGQGIAGFAALWYIGVRVWRHIERAESVDVFPLLRPFAIGIAIMLWPYVITLCNGILEPTVTGTADLQKNANAAISLMLQQKQEALKGTIEYRMYVGPDGNGDESLWESMQPAGSTSGMLSSITNSFQFAMAKLYYNMKNHIRQWMSEVLQLLFEAAALCINTIRIFNLIILAILGPLVLALSVFDGFQHTFRAWMARYANVFLWLPVANIFGAIIGNIQVHMLKLDISQIQQNGVTYFSNTDAGYLIFLMIGIAGYFTVPSVAGYIIQAGGDTMGARFISWSGNSLQYVFNATRNVFTSSTNSHQPPGSFNKDRISGDQ